MCVMRRGPPRKLLGGAAAGVALALVAGALAHGEDAQAAPAWASPSRVRLRLSVDARGRKRSRSPAAVAVDFQAALRSCGIAGEYDQDSIEVVPALGPSSGGRAGRVPHRLDPLFGSTRTTLSFVVPDETSTSFCVYFDRIESRRSQRGRFPGLVGDGDLFREELERREVASSHL